MSKNQSALIGNLREDDSRAWCLLAAALFLLRVTPWSMAELWFDEVLTLQYFAIGGENATFLDIFRNYSMANNHFLNSAVYWWWVRFLNFNFTAHVLRWPSLVFALATIAVVVLHWRYFLGRRWAALAAVMLGISPVFGAFAYQVRGYSLAMFLATVALSGAMEISFGQLRRGQMLACTACLLLPLVMPSAAMLAPSLALLIFLQQRSEKHSWRCALARSLPCLLAGMLGGSYYLTLWQQFQRASQEAGGWISSWEAAGAIALGFLAHAGFFALPSLGGFLFSRWRGRCSPGLLGSYDRQLWFCCVLPIIMLLCLRIGGRAPFPRVFLIYLPVVTLAAVWGAQRQGLLRRARIIYPAVVILLTGSLLENICSHLTRREVLAGHSPQNLLQQYYRGASDNHEVVSFLKEKGLALGSLVLVNEFDATSFLFYWQLAELPPQAVLAANRAPQDFYQQKNLSQMQLFVLARNEVEAQQLFQRAGQHGPFHQVLQTDLRTLFAPGTRSRFWPSQEQNQQPPDQTWINK
ncbi:MAG: hypothetical protein GX564_10365 [Oligosphaeraceae bacterium]|nr:hypothetical protein [Oligosphaeraceae bacterium]